MNKLTRSEAISKFRRQWRGMGETGLRKVGWLEKYDPEYRNILHSCYLCQYVSDNFPNTPDNEGTKIDCSHCPIDWEEGNGGGTKCEKIGTSYYHWEICDDVTEKNALAIQVSELPEKKEEELYLYVEMIDDFNGFFRIVRIKLTQEQVQLSTPSCVGEARGKKIYEIVKPICIQKD